MLHQVRETIASEIRLSEASGELMIRAEFDRVLDRFGPREGEGLLAYNLNWDRVADGALSRWGDARSQRADPVHLHGQATNSSELYLPSEVHFEPYRSSEGQQSLFHQQAALVNAEPLGDRLILYGLSLDPLDAELCTTVALLLHESSIQKIILVNPNHSVVAERLRLFLDDGRPRAVIGIDPAYLSIHSRYDVRWGVPSDSV
jgi:hypothetical protein